MADLPRAQVYVALLRGVNVGGNTLSMERLRGICAELGLENAQTYVQSGNLIFDAAGSAERWSIEFSRSAAAAWASTSRCTSRKSCARRSHCLRQNCRTPS